MSNIFNVLAVSSAGFTALLYWIGLDRFYFWYYPWFDIVLHLVGGLTIGFWGAALASRRQFPPRLAAGCIVILAVLIGVLWESFEYISGLTVGKPDYWFDTMTDLGNGFVGASLVVLFYSVIARNKKTY